MQGNHMLGLIKYMQLSRVVSVEHNFKTQSYARKKLPYILYLLLPCNHHT
jgi:hypothetical protein